MKCEIITIGSEILIGDIINSHSKFLSQKLNTLGFDVLWHTTVGDNPIRLQLAIKIAISRSDLIILTGGLGPTQDDITKETLAKTISENLIENENLKNTIQNKLKKENKKITKNNFQQALIFKKSTIFKNDYGTAPGLAIQKNKKTFILLPGPPNELQPMYENYVENYLQQFSANKILSKNLYLYNITESEVDEKICNLLKQTNPSVGIYTTNSKEVRLRITCKHENIEKCKNEIQKIEQKIKTKLTTYIKPQSTKNLENALIENLIKQKKTIAVAESCTGGLIASKIVSVPNASHCFNFATVCYTNQMKNKFLNVKQADLEKFGAVSRQIAKQMANNVRILANTNIGLSTTGLASPTLNTKQPTGLVYFGITTDKTSTTFKKIFNNTPKLDRNEIIKLATNYALNLAIKFTNEN